MERLLSSWSDTVGSVNDSDIDGLGFFGELKCLCNIISSHSRTGERSEHLHKSQVAKHRVLSKVPSRKRVVNPKLSIRVRLLLEFPSLTDYSV